MNPPSEQLVRDYLNRLSVAAGRLGLEDRQGLLDRTRARIEVESGGLRDATADEVRQALAGLGDPIALVEREQARIAALIRKDAGIGGLFGGRRNRIVRQLRPVTDSDVTAGSADTRAREIMVRPADPADPVGREIVVGSGGPVGLGGPVGSEAAARATPVPVASAVPAWPNKSNGEPRRVGQPGQDGGATGSESPVADDSTGHGGPSQEPPPPRRARSAGAGRATGANPASLPPAQPGEPVPDRDASSASASPPSAGGPDGDDEPASAIELSSSGVEPIEEYAERSWLAGLGGVLVDWLSRLGKELVAVLVRDRLEAIAVVLLGLGGALFPPVWLIGALVALSSRKWDHRDKWLGLAAPVLLVVFGAMLVVVLGGQRQSLGGYATEFWLAAGRLSRLAAVLGASYLLSRVIKYQGKPQRRQPPWSRPAARR